jgi:hypothetical protein
MKLSSKNYGRIISDLTFSHSLDPLRNSAPAVSFDDLLIQDAVRRAVLKEYKRREHK